MRASVLLGCEENWVQPERKKIGPPHALNFDWLQTCPFFLTGIRQAKFPVAQACFCCAGGRSGNCPCAHLQARSVLRGCWQCSLARLAASRCSATLQFRQLSDCLLDNDTLPYLGDSYAVAIMRVLVHVVEVKWSLRVEVVNVALCVLCRCKGKCNEYVQLQHKYRPSMIHQLIQDKLYGAVG